MDESPPNDAKAAIALVGQNAQIMKLASWQGKLADVVATTQSGLNQTYMEADMSIASLWDAVREIRTDLDTLISALNYPSPTMAKKRRLCIKHNAHTRSPYCSNQPRSRAPHCDRIGGKLVRRVVRAAVGLADRAHLDGLDSCDSACFTPRPLALGIQFAREVRQRVLYAVSGRCVCAFAREVRQRVLYAVSGRCVCTFAREVRQRVLYAVSGHCLYMFECLRHVILLCLTRIHFT